MKLAILRCLWVSCDKVSRWFARQWMQEYYKQQAKETVKA